MENLNESLGINEDNSSKMQSNGFADYFSFRTLISLAVIQIVYVLGTLAITISSIVSISKGSQGRYGGDGLILSGFLLLIFGNLFWRLMCEAWILLFRMSTSLSNIEKEIRK